MACCVGTTHTYTWHSPRPATRNPTRSRLGIRLGDSTDSPRESESEFGDRLAGRVRLTRLQTGKIKFSAHSTRRSSFCPTHSCWLAGSLHGLGQGHFIWQSFLMMSQVLLHFFGSGVNSSRAGLGERALGPGPWDSMGQSHDNRESVLKACTSVIRDCGCPLSASASPLPHRR